ncbi:hypothetical protein SBOR_10070 [Sclerotinia borealis F-4128]|uniref:Uncharacterized protein n=1 Tax=Sclerotinia borealis (strain F-4128) TaxID=1432307 RepID=W9C1E6_SCLBF|nr:hypothetical protein SBOR_10070 [Sclerotinia borealis F-4128]
MSIEQVILGQDALSLVDSSSSNDKEGTLSSDISASENGLNSDSKDTDGALPLDSSTSTNSGTNTILTELHPFNRLPNELKLMIFEQALPSYDAKLVNFFFCLTERIIDTESDIYEILIHSVPSTVPDLLPLMLASKMSKEVVLADGFERIAVSIPDHQDQQQRDYLRDQAEEEPFIDDEYLEDMIHQRTYAWMRPSQDTLMIHAKSLMKLYKIGGSMNLSNISYLAVRIESMEFSTMAQEDVTSLLEWVFIFVETHCQSLKKLSLILETFTFSIGGMCYDEKSGLLDIDERFYESDFFDGSDFGNGGGEGHGKQFGREGIFGPNQRMRLTHFSSARDAYSKKLADQENRIAYWKNVEVVHAIEADRPKSDYPWIFIPEILAWVPINADGTLMGRIKNDAQE